MNEQAVFDKSEVIARQRKYVDSITELWPRSVAAVLVENTTRFITDMRGDLFDRSVADTMTEVFGDGWIHQVLYRLAGLVTKSATFTLFPWQPLSAPVGLVHSLRRSVGEDIITSLANLGEWKPGERIPEIYYKMGTDEVSTLDPDLRSGGDLQLTEASTGVRVNRSGHGVKFVPPPPEQRREIERALGVGEARDRLMSAVFDELIANLDRYLIGEGMKLAVELPDTIDTSECIEFTYQLRLVGLDCHRRMQRGPSNHLVIAAEHVAMLEDHPSFKKNKSHGPNFLAYAGPTMVGTLDERWYVISDPLFPLDTAFMGYAGPSLIDAGAMFAPHHLNISRPKGESGAIALQLRSAFKPVNAGFFSKVKLK